MTNEQKQLLLKDLCVRLPYGINVAVFDKTLGFWGKYAYRMDGVSVENDGIDIWLEKGNFSIEIIKPYLRPMSSMTDEERKEYESFIFTQHHEWDGHGTSTQYVETDDVERYVTWLNKNHFDWRGLIPMGIALEAKEGMYD